MWVIQRKADGRFLQKRDHRVDCWTLNKRDAKQYTSSGRAMNGFLAATKGEWWEDDPDDQTMDRVTAKFHIDFNYQFVRTF